MSFLLILFFVIAIGLSALLIPHILVIAFRKRLFDVPDGRKDHVGAIPRLGGISFYPVIFFCFAFYEAVIAIFPDLWNERVLRPEMYTQFCMLFCGMILLYLVGITDDLIGVRYRKKFLVQFLVASFFPLGGLWLNNLYGLFGVGAISPWIGIPLTIVFVVFITNAINLIDGIDGLASGLCMVAFLTVGLFFWFHQVEALALLALLAVGVLLPFFYYNVFGRAENCRKIFMGDTGSLTLGYLLSFLVISCAMYEHETYQTSSSVVTAFAPLLVPALDVIRVVLYRFRNHKALFQPDRNHIHHKFLAMGFSHRRSMVLILLMSGLFVLSNVLLIHVLNLTLLFLLDIVVWTGLNMWFDKRIRERQEAGV